MIKEIKITPEVAHNLSKLCKRERFYFRTLTRTDNTEYVVASIDERGLDAMQSQNIHIIYGKLTSGSDILSRLVSELLEGKDVEQVVDKYVACSTLELKQKLIDGINGLIARRQTNNLKSETK